MPTLAARAAAYTRTGILYRFLDDLASAVPARVDSEYAERILGLKGGDIRAFLQSLRVLGLVDPYGQVTEAGRRSRSAAQRPEVLRERLAAAYPELDARWNEHGSMPREAVEDFFKIEYGLSNSTAAPAAKLFCDLMLRFGEPAGGRTPRAAPPAVAPLPAGAVPDIRIAALDAVKNSLRVEINENWDPQRIELVFDRMERLVELVVGCEASQRPEA